MLPPTVNEVLDTDTKVTGTGEPGANIIVELNGSSEKYTGTVGSNGTFSVDIPKQKEDLNYQFSNQ